MSSNESTPAVNGPGIDFGYVLRKAGSAFIDDIVTLVLAALIACVLSVITLGVLAGPLYAGLCSMVITRVRDGRRPAIGDVFSCMDRFWTFLGASIVLLLTIGLAFITVIGGILLLTIWMYVIPIMVDRRVGLFQAMSASKDVVMRGGFWQHLVLVILLFAIDAVGRGPLALLTAPFSVAVVLVAYLALENRVAVTQVS